MSGGVTKFLTPGTGNPLSCGIGIMKNGTNGYLYVTHNTVSPLLSERGHNTEDIMPKGRINKYASSEIFGRKHKIVGRL